MSDMYLIAGLGNPGAQYAETRHNIGFMCVEALAQKQGIPGKSDAKMKAMVGKGTIKGKKVILIQPLTYMNLSGESLAPLIHYYKIPLEQILVVFDDTDIPFGRIRFRKSGSAGSHNGMKSVIACLNSQEVPRLRVGVGSPPPNWDLADFVLAKFSPEEQAQMPNVLPTCQQALEGWLTHGIERVMNDYNHRDILQKTTP